MPRPRFSPAAIAIFVILAILLMMMFYNSSSGGRSVVPFGIFMQELKKDPTNVIEVNMKGDEILGRFKTPPENPAGEKGQGRQITQVQERIQYRNSGGGLTRRQTQPVAAEQAG